MYFRNYRLWKNWPEHSLKSSFSQTGFSSQHVKASQILAKCPWERFYQVFSSFLGKLIWKTFALAVGEIWGVFVNTLTADGMYSFPDSENLPLPIQMQLSEKRKTFSPFFVPFLESTSNFKHFERNNDCKNFFSNLRKNFLFFR